MKRLLIAAGGGGDAITAAMVHAALYGPDAPALVLTYAWERLVVDPVPGPRGAADFTGTLAPAPGLTLITSRTVPKAPAGSLLPRLAARLRPALGLLDPYGGTLGLARQIGAAARWCGADRIDLVDVGGDIVARGDEPTLRSPLGDALALAACAATGIPTTVYVAGPGLDNEVPLPLLMPRLGEPALTLAPEDTEGVLAVFDWHPSEAGAVLVAAARGARGVCGTRDAPRPLVLDDSARQVHRLTCEEALRLNPLAGALERCSGLEAAEEVSYEVCGFSEIARERRRAEAAPAVPSPRPPEDPEALLARFTAWERSRLAEGLDYVTTRRITEELALTPPEAAGLYRTLRAGTPPRRVPPLWRLAGA
ncbi:DUF1152 domain-containing protein [Streptomyces sp. NPDC090109]|uniref:DUF1152 domain-containing protein n=1 Tax=unclassified Streptomyces TaxID=2593676 RepID=UPI000EF7903A|nr:MULTISPECIES: DUF1152 domain-containing protein [unclassified Streptomyces]MZE54665.1 DUF1152 domain-containing protein [Streptomyces sp. SID5770]